MIGARARVVFGLAALAGLATTCGRESVTALDLRMMPTGTVDGVQLQSVSVDGVPVTLNSDKRDFGNPPRLLTSNDVLTVWFSDREDGKRATAMLLGFRCGVPIGAAVTASEVLRKGQTVTAEVLLNGPNVPTCSNIDGGIGGRGGSGAGGAGGSIGGMMGGAGGGGRGGSGGSAGAAGAGGTGGTLGTGGGPAGTGGTGGALGTAGRGGTVGTAGTTGLAGRGGTTGTAGTTGLAGRGGTTGTGGRGGSGCTATGNEQCFNNLDDDCDGNVDCMDPDCNAMAVCVQLDPALGDLGVVIPNSQTCPQPYPTATTINAGTVMGGSCSGCGCTPPPVTCRASFYDFNTYAECTNDAAPRLVGTHTNGLGCISPVWHWDAGGAVGGVALGPMDPPMYPACSPTGTVTTAPPTWTTTSKFCATAMRGGGCATGSVCLPAITNMPQRCVLAGPSAICPAGTTKTDWYTGTTGNYACNPCMCGQATGASCANIRMYVGANTSCLMTAQFASLAPGEKICATPGSLYAPSIVFTGTPTAPTCQPSYTTSGSLTPSGPQVVCCR